MLAIRGPKILVPPDAEPIDIDECRSHLEAAAYGDTDVDLLDDVMITAWLAAARELCEQFLGLSLSRRLLEVALDRFPTEGEDGSVAIELPFGPVLEIQTVGIDSSSSSTTSSEGDELAPGTYLLDTYSSPNRLLPVGAWPGTSGDLAIKIRYLAGYGVDSSWPEAPELPSVARSAMLLMLGHLYANREEVITGTTATVMPVGVEALLRPLRVRLGMA